MKSSSEKKGFILRSKINPEKFGRILLAYNQGVVQIDISYFYSEKWEQEDYNSFRNGDNYEFEEVILIETQEYKFLKQ